MRGITFYHVRAIASPWTDVPSTALGAGDVREYLLVAEDGVPTHRLDLCRDGPEAWIKTTAIEWEGALVVGFGERVYLVQPSGAVPRCLRLQAYFCDVHAGDGWLLI